jgi:hypothetical protein
MQQLANRGFAEADADIYEAYELRSQQWTALGLLCQRLFDGSGKMRDVVLARRREARQRQAGSAHRLVQEFIACRSISSTVGAIIEFDAGQDLRAVWVAEDEVQMLLRDPVTVACSPSLLGTTQDIHEADLHGNSISVTERPAERMVEGGLILAQQEWSC